MARKAWKAGVCVAAGLACATSSVTLACLIAARIISVSSSWSTSLPFALFSTAVLALVLSVNAALQLTDRWRAARRERAGSRAASSLPRTASAAWHSLSVTACEAVLGVPHVPGWPGLTHAQARAQQLRWGSNSAARPATSSIWRGAAKEVTEPQQVLLLCVAVLYALVGEVEEAALAMGVIALMVAAEVVTEHRAKTALASLQSSAPQYAWVRRRCDDSVGAPYDASAAHTMAWVEVRVLRADVVPGDIILLRAGHQVAADARLLRCTQLEVNEAQLTGESLPVSKHVREEHAHAGSAHDVDEEEACLPAVTPLAERSNMVHADTWVSRGAGVALVVNTGERTEVGQVMCTTRRISSKEKKTPLQVLMKRVAGRLTLVALAGSVAGGLLGLIKAASWQSILLTILSLAFATIPEELPILIAAVLAVGARALGQHRVFVKRLRAMEALSFINVVLTDKTGTLTHNSLRLRRVLCARSHEHGERGLSIGSVWVAAPVADPAGGNAAPAPQSSIALGCTGAEHAQQMLPQKLATQLVRACLFMADAGVLTHAAQLQHAHDPLDAAIGRALIDEQGAVLLSARAVERGTDGGARADVSHADTQEPLAPYSTAHPLAARASCEGLPVWEQAFDSTSKLAIRVFHERAHSANASADNEAEGSASVYLKGAPEAVLACCASALHDEGGDRAVPFTEALRAAVGSELEAAARAGLRTVAYARARVPWYASTANEWDAARADTARCVSLATRAQATLLGVACFEDPVRAEARGAVAACMCAGIRVAIVTGDHPFTAAAVAAQVVARDDDVAEAATLAAPSTHPSPHTCALRIVHCAHAEAHAELGTLREEEVGIHVGGQAAPARAGGHMSSDDDRQTAGLRAARYNATSPHALTDPLLGDATLTVDAKEGVGVDEGVPAWAEQEAAVLLRKAAVGVKCATCSALSVFARATPAHKLQLAQALQRAGAVVAVTGDGVNDAPALAAADVGIAVRDATDVAREASAMVVVDGDFTSLVRALHEGRRLYDNLVHALAFYLGAKLGLLLIFVAGTAWDGFPLAPVQVIVLELFMDIGASLSFVAEPAEADTMRRPPRRLGDPFFDVLMLARIAAGGVSLAACVLGGYAWGALAPTHGPPPRARAVSLAFVCWLLGHILLAFNQRSALAPVTLSKPLLRNRIFLLWFAAVLLLALGVGVWPALAQALALTPLSAQDWGMAVAISVAATCWMEAVKCVRHARVRARSRP